MRINFENNFWDEFPELKIPSKFNELYSADTSKDKKKSSRIMWALHLHSQICMSFGGLRFAWKRPSCGGRALETD